MLEWDEKREQEEPENCPDQPPRTYDKAQEVLHRWATIWLLASLAEVTQCAAKATFPVRLNGFILRRYSCFRKINCGRRRKQGRHRASLANRIWPSLTPWHLAPDQIAAAGVDLDIRIENRYAICLE